jgi:hypothetical protein
MPAALPGDGGGASRHLEVTMKRRFVAALSAASLALAVVAAPASAAKPVSTYYFYDCTGGDLSSFYAVKVQLPAAEGGTASAASAFNILDSTRIYTVYDFGFGAPSGISVSGVASVWCWVTFSGNVTVQVGGQLSG